MKTTTIRFLSSENRSQRREALAQHIQSLGKVEIHEATLHKEGSDDMVYMSDDDLAIADSITIQYNPIPNNPITQ